MPHSNLTVRENSEGGEPFALSRRRALLSAYVDHGAGGGNEVGFTDVMAGFLAFHDVSDERINFSSGAAPHQFGDIVVPDGEQAGADLAVGGDAHAAAVAAEWMGDGAMIPISPMPSRSDSGARFRAGHWETSPAAERGSYVREFLPGEPPIPETRPGLLRAA